MDALHLFGELRVRGIRCTVTNGRLAVESRRGALTDADRVRVRTQKDALIRLFSDPCPCPACVPALGRRICCPSGLDEDSQWLALRGQLDAMDEAEERAAIRAEGVA